MSRKLRAEYGFDLLEPSASPLFLNAKVGFLEGVLSPGAPAKWDRLREDLPRAVEGRLALAARLRPKPLPYGAGASGGRSHIDFPPAVRVDNEASDFYTIVEVTAPDRVGLLYLITRALSDLDLDIHLAKVDTQGARALDSFYVRDREGQKITDDVHLREIERTLCYELSRP